jgi:putative endonuclease
MNAGKVTPMAFSVSRHSSDEAIARGAIASKKRCHRGGRRESIPLSSFPRRRESKKSEFGLVAINEKRKGDRRLFLHFDWFQRWIPAFLRALRRYRGGRYAGMTGEDAGMITRRRNAMQSKRGYVYIVSNKQNGTLYIGVTSDLTKRVYEHKNHFAEGFTSKYDLNTLVYYETFDDIEQAILREKRLKKWNRAWKLRLINRLNPDWRDLYDGICQ